MRIKSRDIHFFQPIFYLANKLIFDISDLTLGFYSIVQIIIWMPSIYLLAFKNWKSLQVSHQQAHDELVNSDLTS